MKSRITVLIFFLLLVVTASSIDINDEVDTPVKTEIELWFNYPVLAAGKDGVVQEYDFLPENKLIELVDAASPNSEIYISMYLFTRQSFSDALIRAVTERDVTVRLIVEDGWQTITKKQKEIVSQLEQVENSQGETGINVVRCNKGCNGNIINHNKFFLFSKVRENENIIVQSSANLTKATGRLYENTVVIREDKELYKAYLNYWHDLAEKDKNLNYFRSAESHGYPSEGSLKIFFFPQKTGDKILDILSNVSCDEGKTSIKVMVSNWDSGRGIDSRLRELAEKGCTVGVIIPDNLIKTKCDVRLNMYPEVDVYTGFMLPHSKYIIIEGLYKDKEQSVVWTGSHNFTMLSLRRTDEILLEIIDKNVVTEFKKNWETIRLNSIKEKYSGADGKIINSCKEDYQLNTLHVTRPF